VQVGERVRIQAIYFFQLRTQLVPVFPGWERREQRLCDDVGEEGFGVVG
jgi:hypothetical protein